MRKYKGKFFAKTKNLSNFYLPILFILTFLLVFFNKADYFLVYKIKSASVDYITPVSNIVSAPVKTSIIVFRYFNDLRNVQKENLKLKEEIIRLKKWQTLAIKNTRENKAYKKLLNSTTNNTKVLKTASITFQSPKIFNRTIILNAGLNHNIKNDLSIVNERGLVGRIISVTNTNSKALLINDQNSSIPVKLIDGDFVAILKGSPDGKYLVSSFVKGKSKPYVGGVLVTSGNANIFPKDILVGKIIKITENNVIAIPYVNLSDLEFVQIISR